MIVVSCFKIIDERQNYLYMIMNKKKKIIIHFISFSPVESIRISFFRIYKEAKRHRAAIRFSLNGFSSHSEILLPTLHRNTFPGWTEILFNNKQHTFWDIAQNLTFMAPLIFLQDPTKFWRAATIKVRNHITLKTFHSTEEKFRNSNLDINILNAPLLFVYHICFWQYFHTNARLRNIWSLVVLQNSAMQNHFMILYCNIV